MNDAAKMTRGQRHRVAARKETMAAVEEQADRIAGLAHQPVNLAIGLDDRAHVMMEGHPDAEVSELLGEFRYLVAVGFPLVLGKRRAVGDRLPDAIMPAARGVGIDGYSCAEIAQQRQMRQDRLEFLVDLAVEDTAVLPAGDETQLVAAERLGEFCRFRGNLPPSSVPR